MKWADQEQSAHHGPKPGLSDARRVATDQWADIRCSSVTAHWGRNDLSELGRPDYGGDAYC